jgi:hypothetical protein
VWPAEVAHRRRDLVAVALISGEEGGSPTTRVEGRSLGEVGAWFECFGAKESEEGSS